MAAGALMCMVACTEAIETQASGTSSVEILDVRFMDILLPGSGLRLRTRGVVDDGTAAPPRLRVKDVNGVILFELSEPVADGEELVFYLPVEGVLAMAPGTHALQLELNQGGSASEPTSLTCFLAHQLDATLFEMPIGTFHRAEAVLLGAEGLLAGGEGSTLLEVDGVFERDDGSSENVDTDLFVDLVDPLDRTRGQVRLGIEIGGASPGTFKGTARVRTYSVTGYSSTSVPYPVEWTFTPPVLFGVENSSVAIGQYLSLYGAGFLGGANSTGLTLLRLEGQAGANGGAMVPFGPTTLYVEWVSDSEVLLPIEPSVKSGELVSALFGTSRSSFSGTITPVVSVAGDDEVDGGGLSVNFTVTGGRQVVVVRFLATFSESLQRFGLSLAEPRLRERILERIETIYADYAVEVFEAAPADTMPAAIATLEIGGPDPNGIGLFGYDNTPGKDVGNLRLSDSIGGSNAEVQEDGAPGYGGVFIESYLWWSSHPGLAMSRPSGAPPVDPLFDEIFDGVRATPATLNEVEGMGSFARVASVQRALAALGSVIGETAAHELGHSFGLAQPHGTKTAFHSQFPGDGCLMDGGFDRPFVERANQAGSSPSTFCGQEAEYLSEVLPID
jgi:hypothetical protein